MKLILFVLFLHSLYLPFIVMFSSSLKKNFRKAPKKGNTYMLVLRQSFFFSSTDTLALVTCDISDFTILADKFGGGGPLKDNNKAL